MKRQPQMLTLSDYVDRLAGHIGWLYLLVIGIIVLALLQLWLL